MSGFLEEFVCYNDFRTLPDFNPKYDAVNRCRRDFNFAFSRRLKGFRTETPPSRMRPISHSA
jgi:hypothetical protein